jgi:RNA polymerase sigma factor (sigma-70 family)
MNFIQDLDLINKIKTQNDSEALKELESRHSGIYNEMVKKYYHHLVNFGLNPSDIVNDKLFVLYKSVISFDESKNVKFSTWLGNQTRYHCLNTLNKRNDTISMDEKDITKIIEKKQINNENDILNIKEKSDLIFYILNKIKDNRISKIFKLRYFNGKKLTPWNKIGKNLKISTQTAINLHDKGKKLIKNKLTTVDNMDII